MKKLYFLTIYTEPNQNSPNRRLYDDTMCQSYRCYYLYRLILKIKKNKIWFLWRAHKKTGNIQFMAFLFFSFWKIFIRKKKHNSPVSEGCLDEKLQIYFKYFYSNTLGRISFQNRLAMYGFVLENLVYFVEMNKIIKYSRTNSWL